jgi:hypothetical protein
MGKYSSYKDIISIIKIRDTQDAVIALVEEQVKNAEADMLCCNPQDDKLRDKLVKAQTFRNFLTILTQDLK